MRRPIRALMAASLATASASAAFGLALAPQAGATSSFTLTRIAGADRYQTASEIDQATFPSGEPTALLADALPGHESDALAASGVEGAYGIGVLLTDNTNTVPSSTLSALSANKVSKVVVLGGTGAVSQSQINQLSAAGYQVSEPYQGATRWQTMEMIDDSMGGAGTDAAGLPTAILASGQDNHLVDALSAGGLSYLKHFPIILTNSTGPGLQPQAQQVITKLGIKHLIVVGGTASIPASEYNPPPAGVTKVNVEAGTDRSNTSQILADFAISNGWLTNTNMVMARGDDGADALAGAPFAGSHGWPTVVTNSTTDIGSVAAFATEHESTLAGTSYILGGIDAVPASQASAVQTAGQGPAPTTAPVGTFGTAAGTTPVVITESASTFTEGGETYTYQPTDTYQIVTTASSPGSSPACTADSYADFQSRLSNGDSVSGNYQPNATSTFCLNDIAPHPPSSVTATTNSSGGVTVSWTAPSTAGTDGVTGYTIWKATATQQVPNSGQYSCTAAYTVSPGTSPQTAPSSSGYTDSIPTQTATSSTSYSYTDPSATAGNEYCYAVSSDAVSASGVSQIGTAQPASPSQVQVADPGAVAGAGTGSSSSPVAPLSVSTSVTTGNIAGNTTDLTQGDSLVVNFNEPMAVASNWSLTLAAPCATAGDTCSNAANPLALNPANASASASGDTVTITLNSAPLSGSSPPTPSGSVPLKNLEALASSGITSVPSSGGLGWNLPGSGQQVPPPPSVVERVFASNTGNAVLPMAPVIYNVDNSSAPNAIEFRCSDHSSMTLYVYSASGALLGTAPCSSSQPATPSVVSGGTVPFTFTPSATYLFTEGDGSNSAGSVTQNDQESLTASAVAGAAGTTPV
ncbi:MAG: cell wall-binding repeat-containing protein, partial [Acidimicrobiales bacterium]